MLERTIWRKSRATSVVLDRPRKPGENTKWGKKNGNDNDRVVECKNDRVVNETIV